MMSLDFVPYLQHVDKTIISTLSTPLKSELLPFKDLAINIRLSQDGQALVCKW